MIIKMFRSELRRCFSSGKVWAVLLAVTAFMILSARENMLMYFELDKVWWKDIGAVDMLQDQMTFDAFKIVIALLLVSLCTGNFCQDLTSQYLRNILSRTDIYTYSLARFGGNLFVIVLISIVASYLYTFVIVCIGFPVISELGDGGLLNVVYYREIMEKTPLIYIGMIGLQLGLVIAVFSSIGMVFSVYQPSMFVSIGVAGLSFYLALSMSSIFYGTPFDILNLVSMQSVLPGGRDAPWPLMLCWGIMYPLLIVAVCCLLFYRRLKWRGENGEL